MADRTPPHDREAEECVIGSVVLDSRTSLDAVATLLRPTDFYDTANGQIFEACLALQTTSRPIDMVTLKTELVNRGIWDDVGGAGYLAKMARKVPHSHHAASYAEIVKRHSIRRSILMLGSDIVSMAYDDQLDVDGLTSSVNSLTIKTLEGSQQSKNVTFADTLMDLGDQIVQGDYQAVRGLQTQYDSINRLCGGLRPGVTVIGARPSLGKTAFADNVLEHVAASTSQAVGLFSLEMLREEKASRFIAMKSRVPQDRWSNLQDWERDQVSTATTDLMMNQILIDDRASVRVGDICAQTRLWARKHDLAFIVIDYLQLIEADNKKDSRQQQVGAISRQLKMLSMELELPILLLSQLNREADGQRPSLRHLREAGDIEQDADTVWLLWKKQQEEKSSSNSAQKRWGQAKTADEPAADDGPADIKLTIAKNRNGRRDVDIDLVFFGDQFRFVEQAASYLDPETMDAAERKAEQDFGHFR